MTENGNKARSTHKTKKLKSALRDNLKKRKGQVRKLGQADENPDGFVVKLRSRDIGRSEEKSSVADSGLDKE